MERDLLELTPEAELVVHCAHLRPTEHDDDRLRQLLARALDWTTILALAQRHGAVALVHERLSRLPADTTPASVRDVLGRRAVRQGRRAERLLEALAEVLVACAARGLDVVPLRGAPLGVAPTEPVEINLLVRSADVTAAGAALAAIGVTPETALTAEQTFALHRTQRARRFLHPAGHVVTVQWDVEAADLVHGPPVDEVWQRAMPAFVAGQRCVALAPADLFQILCVRGTARRWQRLVWIRELAELMATTDLYHLERALLRAKAAGSRRAVGLGASLAIRLLGAPAPLTLLNATRGEVTGELRREVLRDLAAVPRPLPTPWQIARFHLRSRERRRDKLGYAWRHALLPAVDDVAGVRVPAPLFPLLYAVPPVRRAGRVAADVARRFRRLRGRKIARFVRTPRHAIDRMLRLAGVTSADTVFDLGCGDGAILVRAAQRTGCRGLGVELDAELVQAARAHARAAGVDRLIQFVHGDAREVDLTAPTVVTLYLNAGANLLLRSHLQRGLREGARVVSFNFDMGDWWADDVEILDETAWGSNAIYLWTIRRAATKAA